MAQMKHISTRGRSPAIGFDEIVLSGLAPDGGLYLPQAWPGMTPGELAALKDRPYAEVAARILRVFAGADTALDVERACHEAYAGFRHPDVAPVIPLGGDLHVLELFHGPTFAFKDFALQVLGRLMAQRLAQTGERRVIVAATSGDTGSAAIAALADRPGVEIVVLHPKGRVSEVQRRQMTTVASANVHNVALEGTFDDAQDLVKALFNDRDFSAQVPLGAVNSINWARLAIQTAYFVKSSVSRDGIPVNFVVPTGNFGDIFSGYAAKVLGCPVGTLVAATNDNDIIARALTSGDYSRGSVKPTSSPSMDIQIASNFERLLFDAMGRESGRLNAAMAEFASSGKLVIPPDALKLMRRDFRAARAGEPLVRDAIRRSQERPCGLVDPHTATGLVVADAMNLNGPTVVLATAHPAKFGASVKAATGQEPPLPLEFQRIMNLPEKYTVLPNDLREIQAFIRARTGATSGG
jgi:threonine synthase